MHRSGRILEAAAAPSGASAFEERDAEVPRVADEVLKSVRECQALRSRGDTQSLSRMLYWLERMDDALREVYESLDAFRPRRVVP